VVNGDIKFYKANNIHGVIEDGSQRSFFPNGLAFYTYARTLFDTSLSFNEIAEDYLSCAYGEDWKTVYKYLDELGKAFGHDYLSGDRNRNSSRSELFAPEQVSSLKKVKEITKVFRKFIAEHYNSEYRIRTISIRLLEFHAFYADMLSDVLIAKAMGDDKKAIDLLNSMNTDCGKFELQFERYYDHGMFFFFLNHEMRRKSKISDREVIGVN